MDFKRMGDEREIGHLTDFADIGWAASIAACKSVADLRALSAAWPSLTDVAEVVATMTEDDWPRFAAFRMACRPRAKRRPAIKEWSTGYGTIIVPERFLHALWVSETYTVPFGLAWIRLREHGWPKAEAALEG